MVRFKNRHLLVEFLDPASLTPFPSFPTLPPSSPDDANDDDDLDFDATADDEALARIPELPFMLPLSEGGVAPLFGDEGGSAVFKAVRSIVQSVFGDEGWGRIASSFKVVYHSPLTTLTVMRVARQHYRLLWAGVTLLTAVAGHAVLPRVIAVSGTIKKLQNAAIVHHRRVTAAAVATLVAQGAAGEAEKERLQGKWKVEQEEMGRLED